MSILGINGALTDVYLYADRTQKIATSGTSFAERLQKSGGAGTSKVDDYTEHLRSKYGNVRIQSVGKDQQSLDRAGKSMSGSDVVIAPNILEQMANDPEKAAYYEGKIDDFFNATPMLKASFAEQRKASLERSQEAAEERRQEMEIAYRKQTMAEALVNITINTGRFTYTITPD